MTEHGFDPHPARFDQVRAEALDRLRTADVFAVLVPVANESGDEHVHVMSGGKVFDLAMFLAPALVCLWKSVRSEYGISDEQLIDYVTRFNE